MRRFSDTHAAALAAYCEARYGAWYWPAKAVQVHFYPARDNACACGRYTQRPLVFELYKAADVDPGRFCRLCLTAMERRYFRAEGAELRKKGDDDA